LRFEWEQRAQEPAAFRDELSAPRFDLRSSRRQIGSQHWDKLLFDIPWISRNFFYLDGSPISPTRSPINDKAQAQPCRVKADVLKKIMGIEKVSAGVAAEKSRELPDG